ncbi:MAG: Crp/Fnr family transcriptional regulator [Desulfobacterales bacterium]|nr:Crp/Fnr family transcriptional regulator [Desulfobacterales bacterium]
MDEIELIWKTIKPLAEKKKYPKKSWLLNEGEVAKYLFFIEQGCIRSWFNNDGNDITFQFFFEGGFVSSFESLRLGKPSLFNLETIEPSVLYTVPREKFLEIKDSTLLKEAVNELLCRRLHHYQKLFLSRIKNSPRHRYEELLRENPEIFERVPHHYIASYLGITPVSLSRIRNKDKP